VNGIFGTRRAEFAAYFKNEGFNVLSLGNIYDRVSSKSDDLEPIEIHNEIVKIVHAYLSRFDGTTPCIVEGFIRNAQLIADIFSGDFELFTYVYTYPNNAKRYKERLLSIAASENWEPTKDKYSIPPNLLSDTELQELKENGKHANSTVKKLIGVNSEIYGDHLNAFENKIITVLI
jgi:hypothetical protein